MPSCCKLNFLLNETNLSSLRQLEIDLLAKIGFTEKSKIFIFSPRGSICISNCSARRDESIDANMSSLAHLELEIELLQVSLHFGAGPVSSQNETFTKMLILKILILALQPAVNIFNIGSLATFY